MLISPPVPYHTVLLVVIHANDCQKGLLGNRYLPNGLHAFLALGLFLQQFLLALWFAKEKLVNDITQTKYHTSTQPTPTNTYRDITSVTLCQYIFANGRNRLGGNHFDTHASLNGNFELLPRNLIL